jgi:hypothetical protein
VWSARVTMAQETCRQSTVPIIGETVMLMPKRPPRRYGVARAAPYGGGFEEIHADAALAPVMFTPPPQGEGATPLTGVTHSAT